MTLKRMGWIVAALLSTPLIGAAQNTAKPVFSGIEHFYLSVHDAEAEMRFLRKLGFEQALFDPFDTKYRADGKTLTSAYLKINDSQFLSITEPYIPPAAQVAAAGPARAEARSVYGFFHFCFLTPNVSAVWEYWDLAGLKPAPIGGFSSILETVVDNPEIIAHNLGADDTEAMEYSGNRGRDSSLTPDKIQEMRQHPDTNRVSDELFGFEIPVDNVPLWQKFYEKVGLVASSQGTKVRMSSPGNPDLEIMLRLAAANETYLNGTRLLFSVKDAKKAAEQLRSAGLAVEADENQVTVRDTEGIAFVFVQREVPPATK